MQEPQTDNPRILELEDLKRKYYDDDPADWPMHRWIYYPWGSSIQADGETYDVEPHLKNKLPVTLLLMRMVGASIPRPT